MWQTHRIACITYHRYPKDDWPVGEFTEVERSLPKGEAVSINLAEQGSWIGDRKSGVWVREVRKPTTGRYQISLISTAFGGLAVQNAVGLFSRWSQENFFRYMGNTLQLIYLTSIALRRFLRPSGPWSIPSSESWTAGTARSSLS